LGYSVRKALGIEATDKWYIHAHIPQPVYEEEDVSVLWNQAVHTDREVTKNRPDIKGKAVPLQAWIGPEGSRK
jgi:sugar (pentulose or hexulose) kinase